MSKCFDKSYRMSRLDMSDIRELKTLVSALLHLLKRDHHTQYIPSWRNAKVRFVAKGGMQKKRDKRVFNTCDTQRWLG